MNNDPTITLSLPLSATNRILLALAELPAKISMADILEVQRQTQASIQASEAKDTTGQPADDVKADANSLV